MMKVCYAGANVISWWNKSLAYSKIAGFCVVSLILLFGCAQSAEGKPQGLPEGVAISTVELSPNFPGDRTLFVGTEKGRVFRSVDAGLTWAEGELDVQPAYAVLVIALSPNFAQDRSAYLGAAAGLYESVDSGSTWKLLQDTPFNYTLDIMVSPDYETDHTLLVTASEGYHVDRLNLYHSTDEGFSWVGGPSPGIFGKPRYVKLLPDGSLIGATYGSLDRSLDFGETWEPLYTSDIITDSFSVSPNLLEEGGVAFFADPVAGGKGLHRVVLGEWPPVPLYSVGGAIAQKICHRQGYGLFCPFPPVFSPTFAEDGTVFAAGRMGVTDTQARLMKSVDRGITWETMFLPTSENIISIAISPRYSEDQTLYVTARHSLFVSENGGDDWEQLSSTLVEETPSPEPTKEQHPASVRTSDIQNSETPVPEERIEIKNMDDYLLAVAEIAPGFGGFFHPPGNEAVLNVYMLDTSQKAAAEQAIVDVFGPERIPSGGIRVIQGQYSFAQLYEWYHDILGPVVATGGISSTSIHEGKNRIYLGVFGEDDRPIIEQLLSMAFPGKLYSSR